MKSLLSEIELESSIGKGLPQYNLHVASLFEEAKAPQYVSEFCNAAILALGDSVSLELPLHLPPTNNHRATPTSALKSS